MDEMLCAPWLASTWKNMLYRMECSRNLDQLADDILSFIDRGRSEPLLPNTRNGYRYASLNGIDAQVFVTGVHTTEQKGVCLL